MQLGEIMKNKIIKVLWEMCENNETFADVEGLSRFGAFLYENDISEDVLKRKSFFDIVQDEWELDLLELWNHVKHEHLFKRIYLKYVENKY